MISLSVVPTSGHAEVIIGIDGPVQVRDFTLRSPDKIVVDITGATLGLPSSAYDRVTRAGILDVRYSQYKRNIVRVVLTLNGALVLVLGLVPGGLMALCADAVVRALAT